MPPDPVSALSPRLLYGHTGVGDGESTGGRLVWVGAGAVRSWRETRKFRWWSSLSFYLSYLLSPFLLWRHVLNITKSSTDDLRGKIGHIAYECSDCGYYPIY
jgi:hypothetical protein